MDYNDSVLCLDKQKNQGEHYRIQVNFLLECDVKLMFSSCMTLVVVTQVSFLSYGRSKRVLSVPRFGCMSKVFFHSQETKKKTSTRLYNDLLAAYNNYNVTQFCQIY